MKAVTRLTEKLDKADLVNVTVQKLDTGWHIKAGTFEFMVENGVV